MSKITCSKCKFENKNTRHFCEKCGAFLDTKNFEEKFYTLPEVKMMRIVDNLLNVPHYSINWDDVADAYSANVEKISALFNIPGMGSENNAAAVQKIKDFLNLCRNPDFQIAFVGTIKTGKSTLINALLGKNYASMDVTPETAALTKFRSSPRDYVHVTFYTKAEWEKLWASRSQDANEFMREYNDLNAESQRKKWINHKPRHVEMSNDKIQSELEIWSSSKRAEHYFVKEIEVGISTLAKDFPPQVVFVDTPGLSDPVAYRSDLTKEYIRKANAVLVCVNAKNIYKEEIDTISTVFAASSDNKNKVHIIATQWDLLNEPVEDWAKQKAYLIKRLTGPAFFDTERMAKSNILYASAYMHILCRDYDVLGKTAKRNLRSFALKFEDNDEEFRLPDDLKKLQEKTNVDFIMQIIRDKFAGNYKKLLAEEIKHDYIDILQNLGRVTKEKKDSMHELLDASYKDSKELVGKLKDQRKKCDEVKQSSDQLEKILNDVKRKTKTRADVICGKLRYKLSTEKK